MSRLPFWGKPIGFFIQSLTRMLVTTQKHAVQLDVQIRRHQDATVDRENIFTQNVGYYSFVFLFAHISFHLTRDQNQLITNNFTKIYIYSNIA